jgi:HPt (histidine-containing phosphotransfer) domain-containing protein/PAS domain-containing protein
MDLCACSADGVPVNGNIKMLTHVYKFLLCILLLNPFASALGQSIQEGLLDLRSWDFDQEPLIPLRGSWEFHWSQLLTPEDFAKGRAEARAWIKVPGSWSLVSEHPTFGVATYRLRVLLSEPRPLALHAPWILSSSKIFIDGVLIEALGRVGWQREPGTGQSYVRDDIWSFTPTRTEFDIIIQVSNHESMMAGMPHAPTLGTARAIQLSYQRELSLALALFGSFMLMGLYHLCLFALRTQERSTLYFGLNCIAVGLYVFGAEGTVVATWLPNVEYPLRLRLILSWMLAAPAFLYFTRELFPAYFPKLLVQAYSLLSLGLFAYFWLADITAIRGAFYIYQAITGILLLYGLRVFLQILKNREEGGRIFLIGLTTLAVTGIHDLLRAVIDSRPLVGFGLLVFIICQSFLLARRFSHAFTDLARSEQKIRQLNEDLERRVEEKTRDIRSILEHIQLGIFAITGPGRSIHKDHSRYLGTLFRRKEFTGLDAAELLFENSHLSSDERSQATQALDAMLGEPALAFELNCAALPLETLYTEQGTTRIVDLNWHPVIDSHDTIEKILVTSRDVTHLRALEDDANDRKEELQFIQELLNVTPEAFHRFLQNCQEFMAENRKLVNSRSIALRDMEALKVLFINMHTLKGAARSLYLKKITRIFHDVEEYYAVLQKDPSAHWDVERMNRDLDEADRVLSTYESINFNKLGRRPTEEGQTIMPTADLIGIYQTLQTLGATLPDAECERVQALQSQLLPLLYRPLQDILEDIASCTSMLARDLHKPQPQLTIMATGYSTDARTETLLRRIFIHILRNSMDHGIEDAATRLEQGKSEAGLISIAAQQDQGFVHIQYQDDGQGLNLSRLHELALGQGLIPDDSVLAPEKQAELIFCSGLSTAKQLNDISGRGMGMDAVKKYLEEVGGQIHIRLLNKDARGPGHPFVLDIRLPGTFFIQALEPAKDGPKTAMKVS